VVSAHPQLVDFKLAVLPALTTSFNERIPS